MKLFVTMPNLDRLTLRTKALTDAAAWGLKAGVSEAAMLMQQEAVTLAPRDTGALAEGIVAVQTVDEPERQVIEVRSTAPHAQFVEYGTGLRGSGTYPGELPASGVPITGSWVYDYKNQGWQGQVAQPYFRPAYDGKKDEAAQTIRDSIRGELAAARGNR